MLFTNQKGKAHERVSIRVCLVSWTAVALILWDRVLTVRDKWPLLAFKAGAVGWGFVGLTLLFRQII